jgi:hypothetical protein
MAAVNEALLFFKTVMVTGFGGTDLRVREDDPKGRGFKPVRGDGFFSAIKISSIPSFRWEIKLEIV